MTDDIRVKGLSELNELLDQLPVKLERNVMRGALRAGVAVILPVAQANIRSHSGALARSLKLKTGGSNGSVTASLYTKQFYARFVEYGTKPHEITAKYHKAISIGGVFFQAVRHPGAKPKPFLRPALDTQAQAAVVAMGEYIAERLATREGIEAAASVQVEAG